jgi:toxin-antitoxin system PIN domain toxin
LSAIADLLDVNVWLALSVEGHPHHQAALKAWADLSQPSFCRLTQLGLMRLLCNRQVMGRLAFAPEAAWTEYEQLMAAGAVQLVEEPAGLEVNLKSLTRRAKATRDFWTDAYLAAFARSAGMRLVSFDTGFARFDLLDCLLLEADS